MFSRSVFRLLWVVLAAQMACLPTITERCRLVTNPSPPPALPAGFAELDALLLRRAHDLTLASRDLNSSVVIVFHKDFAELLLPELCTRMEKARELAMAGRTAEAGRKYQALLVATRVLAYAVAAQSMAQHADLQKQPGFQFSQDMEKFASEAEPIFIAALSEDPRQIERALTAHPEVFVGWNRLLEGWPARIDEGAHKVAVAKVIWDIAFLVAATYQAAGAAAEIAAAGRPPVPPFPVLASGGGAAAAGLSGAASVELAEVLRRLIALGGLDAGVVAAISLMSAAQGGGSGGVRLRPDPSAHGPHSTFKRDLQTGKVTGHAEWQTNPRNPSGFDQVKRVDVKGDPHFNKATGEDVPPPTFTRKACLGEYAPRARRRYPDDLVRGRPARAAHGLVPVSM